MLNKKLIWLLAALSALAQAEMNIQRWKTAEGTEILLVERHDNPIVDLEISFKGAGSAFEPQNKNQTAEFAASLLTDGTKKLDEEAFNAAANDLAAQIHSGSNSETAAVSLRSLSAQPVLNQSTALVNQSLAQPRFDAAVFERRRKQAVALLQQMEADSGFIASRALTKLAYPKHAYSRRANITADGLRRVKLSDIKAFYRTHYGKNNAVAAVVGDVDKVQAEKLVQSALNGLPEKVRVQTEVAAVLPQKAARKNLPFAGEQAQIVLGMPLIKRSDPDYYALVAGNYILGGGGFDSRLMKRLRDEKGYTYGISSSLLPAKEAGLFSIAMTTQKPNAQAALCEVQAVLKQFLAEGPTEAELAQAKANIIGSFPLRFDSNAKLVKYLSMIGTNNLPSSWLDDYPKAVEKLTAEDIKSVWQRRVKAEDLNIVLVGAE